MAALEGVPCVHIFPGMTPWTAWVHFHRKYSTYRHQLNHAQPAGASAVGQWGMISSLPSTSQFSSSCYHSRPRLFCFINLTKFFKNIYIQEGTQILVVLEKKNGKYWFALNPPFHPFHSLHFYWKQMDLEGLRLSSRRSSVKRPKYCLFFPAYIVLQMLARMSL